VLAIATTLIAEQGAGIWKGVRPGVPKTGVE
jgi:hypothetical protein